MPSRLDTITCSTGRGAPALGASRSPVCALERLARLWRSVVRIDHASDMRSHRTK
jgi:hypothetical protein